MKFFEIMPGLMFNVDTIETVAVDRDAGIISLRFTSGEEESFSEEDPEYKGAQMLVRVLPKVAHD